MTEDSTPETPRPVPDLGFYAGPVGPGGPDAGVGSAQFGTAPQFSTAPLVGIAPQFGTGPQFGEPVLAAAASPQTSTPTRSFGPATKAVAVLLAVVVLVGGFFGGRFFWQQFVAAPVVPDTLLGLPRLADAGADAQLDTMRDGLMSELGVGSEAKLALYSDGGGVGYLVASMRGGGGPADESNDSLVKSWTRTEHDGATCFSTAAQPQLGLGVTFCYRAFWRRGVVVMGFGLVPPEPATVAQATNEAWDAQ
jgi:hypothetical protein